MSAGSARHARNASDPLCFLLISTGNHDMDIPITSAKFGG